MLLLNFAHPITPAQRARIEELAGQSVERVVDVPAQFDPAQPYAEQARALVEAAGLTSQEWQTLPLLVNLPSFNVIAALALAELHGRMGYFPTILRLRPIAGSTPPQFEVAEIINLQAVRDAARMQR
ncbi:MAG: CRISPR-associated protein Csx15 [Chloroflexi bacterium]|nr:CRISPR-associated protein Csx15 [Chloroflexota bacterium]